MTENIMKVVGGTFFSEVEEPHFNNIVEKMKPAFIYAEVHLCDARMRNLPHGWVMTKDSDFYNGIARCLWEDSSDAFFVGENGCSYFDRDRDINGPGGSGFLYDLYKIALYMCEGCNIEVKTFIANK
jgi:hypothetical protein